MFSNRLQLQILQKKFIALQIKSVEIYIFFVFRYLYGTYEVGQGLELKRGSLLILEILKDIKFKSFFKSFFKFKVKEKKFFCRNLKVPNSVQKNFKLLN